MQRIYLDYAATTPVEPEVLKSMLPYFTEQFGNPSTIYTEGQLAKAAMEKARQSIADLIGAKPEEIIFTSGGTESDNFALKGIAYANQSRGNHIITSSIEHHAVLEPCKFLQSLGFNVTYIGVDKYGLVDPQEIKKAITAKTILISIMHANNEIGAIQPIEEIAKITQGKGIYFHTDAVQTIGHLPVNVQELGVDLLSLSGHKFYGPKGVGALFVRKGVRIASFLEGGAQERNRRASTENVAGIVGLAKALEISYQDMPEEINRLTQLRDKLIKDIKDTIEDVRLNGHPIKRLPNNVNVSIRFVEGESLLLNLDLAGIAAATGSACSTASLQPSHVITALGLSPEYSHGSLRFSLGKSTRQEDIDYALQELVKVVKKLRAMSPLHK